MLLYILEKAFYIIRELFFWIIVLSLQIFVCFKTQLLNRRNNIHSFRSIKPGFCGTQMVPELMVHNNRRFKPPRVSLMGWTRGHIITLDGFPLMFLIFLLEIRMSVYGTLSAKVERWVLNPNNSFPSGECFSFCRTKHILIFWVVSKQSLKILFPTSCLSQCFFFYGVFLYVLF